jgi:hypothetical protein
MPRKLHTYFVQVRVRSAAMVPTLSGYGLTLGAIMIKHRSSTYVQTYMTSSLRFTRQHTYKRSAIAFCISLWNTGGAQETPMGIRVHSNRPSWHTKAAFLIELVISLFVIQGCEHCCTPFLVKMSWMRGRGCLFIFAISLTAEGAP